MCLEDGDHFRNEQKRWKGRPIKKRSATPRRLTYVVGEMHEKGGDIDQESRIGKDQKGSGIKEQHPCKGNRRESTKSTQKR